MRSWLLVAMLGLVWNLPFLLQAGGLDDEGVTSLGAWRVLQGEHPYRDFDTRHSPGSYYTAALGLGVLGPTQLSVRLLMLLNASLLGVALYAVGCRLLPGRWPLVAWLLFSWAGVTQWPILSYHWMATLAYLIGVWALLARRWGLTGASLGLTFWYLQSEGAALGLAAGLVLGLDRAPTKAWRDFIGWAALSSLILWSPVLLTAGPAAVWRDSVAAMSAHVPFNHSPYTLAHLSAPLEALLGQWAQGTLSWKVQSLSYWSVWAVKYGLYFPVLAAAAWAGWRRGGALRDLALIQVILTLALSNRLDMLYHNYLTPLWYVLLLAVWRSRALAALLLTLFGVQYGFMAWDARSYVYPIETPAGRLYSASPELAASLNHLYGVARQLTPPGSRTLAYPYVASFYFLSQTRNATRYPVLVPVLYPREEAVEAARQRQGCAVIYRVPLSPALLADYPTVSIERFEAESRAFDELLLQGYRLQGKAGPAEIWRLPP